MWPQDGCLPIVSTKLWVVVSMMSPCPFIPTSLGFASQTRLTPAVAIVRSGDTLRMMVAHIYLCALIIT